VLLLALCADAQSLLPEQQFAQDAKVLITAGQAANSAANAVLACDLATLQAEATAQAVPTCAAPTADQLNNDNLAVAADASSVFTDILTVWQQQDQAIGSLQSTISNQSAVIAGLQSAVTKLQSQVAYLCSRRGNSC
jgi:hypothetical protein